ncbi:TPA: hypothetical protein KEY68_001161 [Providencia rettgeri]|uniref:hypothetical protein n=1 Tax=Providencia TaxID=586 RepID=UPI001B8EAA7E|nr:MULTISPECIES: hypothetical protein [Providencia]MDK7743184.1 hypothetical protein [Providencia rettgeri]MDK7756027.1 hypothetical protein [Providencia rettgeri]HBC7428915.1 hypothetical protein [Providencia rettgeri]
MVAHVRFPLRAEPATSLPTHGLTTESFTWECIDVVWLGLLTWIGIEMVGRAGFKSFGFTLRAEPTTSLPRYGLATKRLLSNVLMLFG